MGSTRHRSSPFPFITLSKAIERTRQLWDEQRRSDIRTRKKATFDIEELASAWRYGAKSGGLTQTAAALIQFGLLIPKGGLSSRRFAFTSISLELMKASSRQRNAYELKQKAALMPKMHRELFPKFGGAHNVDDAEIQQYLIEGRALAHKAAFSAYSAHKLVIEYRATMKEAGLSEVEPRPLPPEVFEDDGRSFDFGRRSNVQQPLGPAPPEVAVLMDSLDLADPQEMVRSSEFRSSTSSKRNSNRLRLARRRHGNQEAGPAHGGPAGGKKFDLWDQGILSPTAEYQILIFGKIGQKEIEILIRRLEISKESLAGGDK